MFDDRESERCIKNPRTALEAFPANLQATPGLTAHKAQSPHGGKSCVLEHKLGRPESSLS